MDNLSKGDLNRPIVEWKGKTVITTALLAKAYETDSDNVKKNFSRHKDNFIEGTHYFLLQGEELKEFKRLVTESHLPDDESLKFAPQLYLWTERGANRHCKILDTDKAWEQFDNLEETYFNKKQEVINRSELSPQMQMFYAIADGQAKMELEQKRLAKEVEEVKQKQTAIEQTQSVIADTFQKADDTEDFQKWANNCISQIAESPKFTKGQTRSQRYSLARTESYERLKQKRNCRLDDRVQKAIGRALEERPDIKKTELQKINKIYIIANDKDLRPAYELVIKEMMVCYCVKSA